MNVHLKRGPRAGLVASRVVRRLLLLLGVALALAACSSDPELTIVTEGDPEPVLEAAGSPGLDSFFPLTEQLEMTAQASQGDSPTEGVSNLGFPTPEGAISDLTVGLPSDEDIKSGLYGGTAENTCDPERLIQYLLDHPSKGQVWADVQGIGFVDIPDYIRSLTPTVLTEAVTVLNHGFDPKGHAIPIISTLAEGTAVLVDENGDVRTRCYCGNPILPYTPVTYVPPKCLAHYAVVYTSPANRESILSAPRAVHATKNVATYDQVRWTEVSWGVDKTIGWVRTHEAQDRYCKPVEIITCVGASDVVARPAGSDTIGTITQAHISVLTPDVQGWTLVKFGEKSGWISTSVLNSDDCDYDVNCADVTTGTWTRPGMQGRQIVPPQTAQGLRLTGQSVLANGDAYLQVYVTYPAPTRVGYVRAQDVNNRPDQDCTYEVICTPFDQDIPVYEDATSATTIGWLWFGQKPVVSGPTNGRYEIVHGGQPGWIDLGDLNTAVPVECQGEVVCAEFLDQAYAATPPSSGRVAVPSGPTLVTFTGSVLNTSPNPTYREFHTASTAVAWTEAAVGYRVLDDAECQPAEVCNPENPAAQPCKIECSLNYQVGPEGQRGWSAETSWASPSYPLDVTYTWPAGWAAAPTAFYSWTSTTGSFAPASMFPVPNPVTVVWANLDPGAPAIGSIDCGINWCSILPFDGDLPDEIADQIPEDLTCLEEVICQIDTSDVAPPAPGGSTAVDVMWSPVTASLDLYFDWSTLVQDQQLGVTGGSASSSTPGYGSVRITWYGPHGQQGTIDCAPCLDDIRYPDGGHSCCIEGEPPLGDTGRCCNTGDVPLPGSTWCCPPEDFENRRCCPDPRLAPTNPEFCQEEVPVTPTPVTPTAVPATPTPTPPPATPTPTPEIVDDVRPTPTAVPPPPPTATAIPTPIPTVTPTPVCDFGIGPDGQCVPLCNPGDLLTTQACVCVGDGTRVSADRIQCEIVCPAGQVNLSPSQCGVPEVPTPVEVPTVEVPRCDAPLKWNADLGQCTD